MIPAFTDGVPVAECASVNTPVQQDASATLNRLFDEAVRRFPQRPFLIAEADGSRFTFSDAAQVVHRIAAALFSAGLKKGDRVAIVSAFHAEAVLLILACWQRGLIPAPLNHRSAPRAAFQAFELVTPRMVFVDRPRRDVVSSFEGPVVVFDDSDESLPTAGTRFCDWLDEKGDGNPPDDCPDERDPGVILFTSGTTGEPKGVTLSHGSLWRSGALVQKIYGWNENDTLWSIGELHAMSGLRNPCIASLHAGCAVLCARESASANVLSVVDCAARQRCTIASATPALLRQLVDQSGRLSGDGISLRHIICTGSALRVDTITRFVEHYRVPVYNYYGLTETTGICTAVPPGSAKAMTDTVGKAAGTTLRIENGELLVGPCNLMLGYWNNPTATAAMIRDGWLHTGDEARIDDEGYVTLKGRIRDIVKDSRGDLIHPAEIEEALLKSSLLKDAGVCGFLSAHGDERMAAFVVPRQPGADEAALVDALRRQVALQLGNHRIPSRFVLRKSLPRDGLGSLLRRELAMELRDA